MEEISLPGESLSPAHGKLSQLSVIAGEHRVLLNTGTQGALSLLDKKN